MSAENKIQITKDEEIPTYFFVFQTITLENSLYHLLPSTNLWSKTTKVI